MKRRGVVWLAAGAIVPLLAIGLALAGCGKTSAASSKTGVSASAKAKPAATVYTCPMHPDVKSSKPAKCPKCGMNLVAKKVAAPAKPAAKAKAQPSVYTCPMHPDVKSSKPGKCPKCGMNLVAKKVAAPAKPAAKPKAQPAVYTCPMHPDVKSSKPGKCPKCGMNLVLKKARAALPMTAPAAAAALAAKHAVALQDPETGSGCTMAPCDMSACPTCAAKSGT